MLFKIFAHIGTFTSWAMLGSNQRPLPCEDVTPYGVMLRLENEP